jgi:hypothetical protein
METKIVPIVTVKPKTDDEVEEIKQNLLHIVAAAQGECHCAVGVAQGYHLKLRRAVDVVTLSSKEDAQNLPEGALIKSHPIAVLLSDVDREEIVPVVDGKPLYNGGRALDS